MIYDKVLRPEVSNPVMKKSSVLKQARVKLAQRIGCIFLKPRVAKWRYQRGARSLAANLSTHGIISSSSIVKPDVVMEHDESDDELDENQYEQLEMIIQLLLESLKEDDSVVRWTAAKGLGRITTRLN
jgi:tubulin-specific chaperone D